MKKGTKIFVAALALVLVFGAVVGGTLAWLMDKTHTIENTFTIGNVDIKLAETSNDEFKIIPGTTYTKDPTVTVCADSEECYLFVVVSESTAAFKDFVSYQIAEGWTELEAGVYYREVGTNGADQPFPVIKDNTVAIPGTLTQEQINGLNNDGETLSFTAYAVQKANITDANESGSAVDDAWALAKTAAEYGN